jgi:hypothetical protein
MTTELDLRRSRLTTPRAAAIAGILFSVLLITSLAMIRLSIPADPREAGQWLAGDARPVELALNLLPFAGIAFLWFMGVIRDRLGEYEDQLFATVFLGSGLLFLAMLFASAALAGGIVIIYGASPTALDNSGAYGFARAATYVILNTYAIKMAGVFMISTGTLFLRTRVTPRWMALLGYVLALLLLVSISRVSWVFVVFPLWILLISIYILIENFRRGRDVAMSGPDAAASSPAKQDGV